MLCYFFFCRDESTVAIVNTLLAIFVIITIALIILLLVGFKLHWIEFNRGMKKLKVQKVEIVHILENSYCLFSKMQ